MSSDSIYKLKIEISSPKIVSVDEKYQIIYEITNLDKERGFPGAHTYYFYMRWSSITGNLVNTHPLVIGELEPGGSIKIPYDQIDKVSGMTYLVSQELVLQANDGKFCELYLPNGNRIERNQIVHSIRVRSAEEILQEKLINSLERASMSQDRLERANIFLGIVIIGLTIVQIILFLIK